MTVTSCMYRVFQGDESNEVVYSEFCAPIIKSVVDGFNGTIFAYGQTSSGKTFTMMGEDDGKTSGIIHFTISDIFNLIQSMSDRKFLLRVSYMEIYNEMVRDLLLDRPKGNLKVVEDKYGRIKVLLLTEHIVRKPEEVLELVRKAERRRKTCETLMNKRSNRSHTIFRMIIESSLHDVEDAVVNVAQFNLVDLAGSERARETGVNGGNLIESKHINLSLLTLGQVINQLSEKVSFVNYRGSNLTRILQNSLGGNAHTAIICTVTPAATYETHSTLMFATRAKCIKNKPQVNEIPTKQALLNRYLSEIKKLTEELEATKAEKNREKKNLQDRIQEMESKFVFYVSSRQNKNESVRLLTPSNESSSLEEEESSESSLDPLEDVILSQISFSDLLTFEAESCLDLTNVKDSSFSTSSPLHCSKYFPEERSAVVKTVETNTDIRYPPGTFSESDRVKMSEHILCLEKELKELREYKNNNQNAQQNIRCEKKINYENETGLPKRFNISLDKILKSEAVQKATLKAREEKALIKSGSRPVVKLFVLQQTLTAEAEELDLIEVTDLIHPSSAVGELPGDDIEESLLVSGNEDLMCNKMSRPHPTGTVPKIPKKRMSSEQNQCSPENISNIQTEQPAEQSQMQHRRDSTFIIRCPDQSNSKASDRYYRHEGSFRPKSVGFFARKETKTPQKVETGPSFVTASM